MALNKYPSFIVHSDHEAFDTVFAPNAAAPFDGIYRCNACSFELPLREGQHLPPTPDCRLHHAQWQAAPGAVIWRLAFYAVHTNK